MSSQLSNNKSNVEFSKIFKSRETLIEILYSLDYDVSEYKTVVKNIYIL